jgi:hypothetical protein
VVSVVKGCKEPISWILAPFPYDKSNRLPLYIYILHEELSMTKIRNQYISIFLQYILDVFLI